MINYADNWFWENSLRSTDLGGRGFNVAEQVSEHSRNGCNKICYSRLVPGLLVLHAQRGYLKDLKFYYGRNLRPVTATRTLLEQAITRNAERFDITVDLHAIDIDIARMLAPSARFDSFEIGCSREIYEESANAA